MGHCKSGDRQERIARLCDCPIMLAHEWGTPGSGVNCPLMRGEAAHEWGTLGM